MHARRGHAHDFDEGEHGPRRRLLRSEAKLLFARNECSGGQRGDRLVVWMGHCACVCTCARVSVARAKSDLNGLVDASLTQTLKLSG